MVVTGIRHTLTRGEDFHNFNHDVVLICNSKTEGEKAKKERKEERKKKTRCGVKFFASFLHPGLGDIFQSDKERCLADLIIRLIPKRQKKNADPNDRRGLIS